MEKGECTEKFLNYKKEIENIENNMRRGSCKRREPQVEGTSGSCRSALCQDEKEFEQKERKHFWNSIKMCSLILKKMFNAKDKKIQLTEQYEIQMLYQTERGYWEEKIFPRREDRP